MSPLSESPRQQADREFESVKCAVCGGEKKPKTHFCNRCFFQLPESFKADMRSHSYGEEFALAHEEARDWLLAEQRAHP